MLCTCDHHGFILKHRIDLKVWIVRDKGVDDGIQPPGSEGLPKDIILAYGELQCDHWSPL
ncbi:hypothetical protein PAGU2196_50400 [Pseudomonas sp. PAGU 2196]|nr:hypothetical protein PAGU2196_50400 [Pseudomonas sp. PAGU 2196]